MNIEQKTAFDFPTLFSLPDPTEIPQRAWLCGNHLIRRNVSVTLAPGGVGKSSFSIVQALELATGRRLLTTWNAGPLKVWLFNLEDEREELNRRFCGAAMHYGISREDISDRLFIDSGRENQLILAEQNRDSIVLNRGLIAYLKRTILEHNIDVLIVDPFVSSHLINEMDNGKMDVVTKTWIGIADEANIAIELIHHTRKLNGAEATSDASRGASSLVNAARSSRVLQKFTNEELVKAGVKDLNGTYFYVKRDKSNLAVGGGKETFRTVSVSLGQGDNVGVVERFQFPSTFDGIGQRELIKVQRCIDGKGLRYSDQTGSQWVGNAIARVLDLDPVEDKSRILSLIREWLLSGALVKKSRRQSNGKFVPEIDVGEWAN